MSTTIAAKRYGSRSRARGWIRPLSSAPMPTKTSSDMSVTVSEYVG